MQLQESGLNNKDPQKMPASPVELNQGIYKKSKLIKKIGSNEFREQEDGSLILVDSSGIEKLTKDIQLLSEEVSSNDESLELGEEIMRKIDKNYPLFKLLKEFQNGGEYNAMIFAGVKELNDKKNQSFTDGILAEFKRTIHQKENQLGLKIVFDDYKNFIVAKNDGSNLNSGDSNFLQKILDEIYNKHLLQKYPGDLLQNPIKVFSKTGKIEKNSSQVAIITSIAKIRSILEKEATENEGIKITKNLNDIIILEENITKKYLGSFTEAVDTIENGFNFKYEVEKGVLTKKFEVNLNEVTEKTRIFERKDGKIVLNLSIVSKVKKSEIPENLELYKDIKLFIKSCIVYGEFIFPGDKSLDLFKKGEIVDKKIFSNYQKTISEIESGNMTSNYSLLKNTTYKNALSKESFYESINTEGNLYFIDIKGMGVENIRDFFNVIKKAVNNEKLDTEEKKLEYILLNSGDVMTNKIKKFSNFIKELFGNSIKIYIGGDEIVFFIPKKGQNFDKNIIILDKIFKESKNLGLNIRLTTKEVTVLDLDKSGEKNVSELDELTKLSKILEKRIDLLKETMELNKLRGEDHTRDFNSIKDFILFKENGEIYIDFINNPFEGKQIFETSQIINLERGELVPNSIFIKFLEEKFKILK